MFEKQTRIEKNDVVNKKIYINYKFEDAHHHIEDNRY